MMFLSFYFWLFSWKLNSMPMTISKVFLRALSFFLSLWLVSICMCALTGHLCMCVSLPNARFNGECTSVRLSIDYRFVLVTATLQHNTHRSWSEYEQQFYTAHRMIGDWWIWFILYTLCIYLFFFEVVITHMHRVYVLKTNTNRHLKMHNRNAHFDMGKHKRVHIFHIAHRYTFMRRNQTAIVLT